MLLIDEYYWHCFKRAILPKYAKNALFLLKNFKNRPALGASPTGL